MIPNKPESRSGMYAVWLYDGFDNEWIECSEATRVPWETALAFWNERTNNGTTKTKYADIDYYTIDAA